MAVLPLPSWPVPLIRIPMPPPPTHSVLAVPMSVSAFAATTEVQGPRHCSSILLQGFCKLQKFRFATGFLIAINYFFYDNKIHFAVAAAMRGGWHIP